MHISPYPAKYAHSLLFSTWYVWERDTAIIQFPSPPLGFSCCQISEQAEHTCRHPCSWPGRDQFQFSSSTGYKRIWPSSTKTLGHFTHWPPLATSGWSTVFTTVTSKTSSVPWVICWTTQCSLVQKWAYYYSDGETPPAGFGLVTI